MQIWINKKNKLVKKETYGAIDGFILELSEDPFVESFVEASASDVVGVVGFPDASVDDDENNENVFPNIPFPEASVVGVVGFPDASVDDENNENDSKFGENNASILVVPPNNDEIIFFIKVYCSITYYYYIIIIIKIYFLFVFRI